MFFFLQCVTQTTLGCLVLANDLPANYTAIRQEPASELVARQTLASLTGIAQPEPHCKAVVPAGCCMAPNASSIAHIDRRTLAAIAAHQTTTPTSTVTCLPASVFCERALLPSRNCSAAAITLLRTVESSASECARMCAAAHLPPRWTGVPLCCAFAQGDGTCRLAVGGVDDGASGVAAMACVPRAALDVNNDQCVNDDDLRCVLLRELTSTRTADRQILPMCAATPPRTTIDCWRALSSLLLICCVRPRACSARLLQRRQPDIEQRRSGAVCGGGVGARDPDSRLRPLPDSDLPRHARSRLDLRASCGAARLLARRQCHRVLGSRAHSVTQIHFSLAVSRGGLCQRCV